MVVASTGKESCDNNILSNSHQYDNIKKKLKKISMGKKYQLEIFVFSIKFLIMLSCANMISIVNT